MYYNYKSYCFNYLANLGKLFLVLILSLSGISLSYASDLNTSVFDMMNFKEILDVTLETDVENIHNNPRFKGSQIGILRFEDSSGEKQAWAVNLNLRGRFRRTFATHMPPLKLDFSKKELNRAGLAEYDSYKLVTLFNGEIENAYETLIKEYMAYKLYNELTENSYRVQLLKITYKNIKTGKEDKQWAFLIEDTKELRERIGAEKTVDWNELDKNLFDQDQLNFMAFFQYMIGNSDYSLDHGKNLKTFLKDGKIICVPYDFDFSGIVDADYAVPDNSLDIKSVRDRIYLGISDKIEDLTNTIRFFEKKKENLLGLLKKCKLLNKDERSKTFEYLNTFYEELELRKTNNIALNTSLS